MDFQPYLELFKDPTFWILVLEMILIPVLFTGPEYGMVRVLNWLKSAAKLSGKAILGIPVMRIVAGVASFLASLVAVLVDGTLRGVPPEPVAVVGFGIAFYTLSQSWYAIFKQDEKETLVE